MGARDFMLPLERTIQNSSFKIIGIDYAGPLICKAKRANKLSFTYYYLHAVLPESCILNSYQINLHVSS